VLVLSSRDTPSPGGGDVDTAFQHPMCHAKKISAVTRLFKGFRNEVFPKRFSRAVQNCAGSKSMNREKFKKIPHLTEKSHTTSMTRKRIPPAQPFLVVNENNRRFFPANESAKYAASTAPNAHPVSRQKGGASLPEVLPRTVECFYFSVTMKKIHSSKRSTSESPF